MVFFEPALVQFSQTIAQATTFRSQLSMHGHRYKDNEDENQTFHLQSENYSST